MAINTESVNKQIYDLIKRDILERRLKPGEKIDTKGIAEENGISVMPVRNALQQLATNGLVLNRERVGFYVRKFNTDEIYRIMEVRMMFELHCMQNHMDGIDRNQVQKILDQIKCSISQQELDELDHEMHRMIIHASENEFLISEYDRLNALFALGVSGGEEVNVHTAKKEHIEILNAILSGNVNKAVDQLQRHLERAKDEIAGIYRD